jgi:hypothetical protein
MNRRCLELPEAAGRTLEALRVYDDPPYGREVHLTFTDGTQMSIDLEIETVVRSKRYRMRDGDIDVLERHEDRSVSAER